MTGRRAPRPLPLAGPPPCRPRPRPPAPGRESSAGRADPPKGPEAGGARAPAPWEGPPAARRPQRGAGGGGPRAEPRWREPVSGAAAEPRSGRRGRGRDAALRSGPREPRPAPPLTGRLRRNLEFRASPGLRPASVCVPTPALGRAGGRAALRAGKDKTDHALAPGDNPADTTIACAGNLVASAQQLHLETKILPGHSHWGTDVPSGPHRLFLDQAPTLCPAPPSCNPWTFCCSRSQNYESVPQSNSPARNILGYRKPAQGRPSQPRSGALRRPAPAQPLPRLGQPPFPFPGNLRHLGGVPRAKSACLFKRPPGGAS
ncbi:proline-rich protein 2-like [Talpa occidentalis]|uniref:proline-rich protein 2-like n=1 Tax=Talpa occidentalis TaxID=50954 RepID=UPI0023F96A2F|nr:proline-rich protein 2-like [Talpa occidentalis]